MGPVSIPQERVTDNGPLCDTTTAMLVDEM